MSESETHAEREPDAPNDDEIIDIFFESKERAEAATDPTAIDRFLASRGIEGARAAAIAPILVSLASLPELRDSSVAVACVPGERLGPFEIIEEHGRGGMGVVYRARHLRTGQVVALKVVPWPADSDVPRGEQEVLRAPLLAGLFDDPCICPVYDAGRHDDDAYLAMPFLSGRTLGQAIAADDAPSTALQIRRVVEHGFALARATSRLHAAGVIHGDLTPRNVVMVDANSEAGGGRPVILDFGIASLASDESPAGAGTVAGTLPYMSRERLLGEPATPHVDAWSLAVTLFEWLTGSRPFAGRSADELCAEQQRGKRPSARSLNRHLPGDVDRILSRALAPAAEDRYATIALFADDLEAWLAGRPISARASSLRYRALLWAKRHRVLTAMGIFLLVASVATFAIRCSHRSEVRRVDSARIFELAKYQCARGLWSSGLANLDHAEALGYGDGIALELLRVRAYIGSLQDPRAEETLDRLIRRNDLGNRRSEVLLLHAAEARDRQDDLEAGSDEVREALASGHLSPDQAAYARAFLARTPDEARSHLESAAHPTAPLIGVPLLVARAFDGDWSAALEQARELRALTPDSAHLIVAEAAMLRALGRGEESARVLEQVDGAIAEDRLAGAAAIVEVFHDLLELREGLRRSVIAGNSWSWLDSARIYFKALHRVRTISGVLTQDVGIRFSMLPAQLRALRPFTKLGSKALMLATLVRGRYAEKMLEATGGCLQVMNRGDILVLRGLALVGLERKSAARSSLLEALEARPGWVDLRHVAAVLLIALWQDVTEAREPHPEAEPIRKGAVRAARFLIESPETSATELLLAVDAAVTGHARLSLAMAGISRGLREGPLRDHFMEWMAVLDYRRGAYASSAWLFREVLRTRPNSKAVRAGLQRSLRKVGRIGFPGRDQDPDAFRKSLAKPRKGK